MLKFLGTFYKSTSSALLNVTLHTVLSENCKLLSLLHIVEKGLTAFHLFKDFNKNDFFFHFCGRNCNKFQCAKTFAKSAAPLQHVSNHRLKLWNIRDIANISYNTISTFPPNAVPLPNIDLSYPLTSSLPFILPPTINSICLCNLFTPNYYLILSVPCY